MNWVETIVIRTASCSSTVVAPKLRTFLKELVHEVGAKKLRVFHHESVGSDICIVLFHGMEKKIAGGSPLGLRLATALKEFGLVNHTVWREFEK